jgi:hypothetical protein
MKLDNLEIGFVYREIDRVEIKNKIKNYIDVTLSKQNEEPILRFVIKLSSYRVLRKSFKKVSNYFKIILIYTI